MGISDADRRLMEQVVEYYKSTKPAENSKSSYKRKTDREGSINETASHFSITRTKVTKMLVTAGVYVTPLTEEVQRLRSEGLKVKEIAEKLGVSVGTVSSYLPYTDEIHGSVDPSDHAAAMRGYRAYEKAQKARHKKLKERGNREGELAREGVLRREEVSGIGGPGMEEETKDTPGVLLFPGSSGSSSSSAFPTLASPSSPPASSSILDASTPEPTNTQGSTTTPAWKKEWEKERKILESPSYSRSARVSWENLWEYMPEDAEKIIKADQREREQEMRDQEELATLKALPEKTPEQEERIHELIRDLGISPGMLKYRNRQELEALSGDRLPLFPSGVIRLHLELDVGDQEEPLSEEERKVLQTYAGLKGECITRDIVVPETIPLYALHFVIQRVFGWESIAWHHFYLPEKKLLEFCDHSSTQWKKMVGVIFRSPYMNDEARSWAEDYESGSFKNWLRKKYTGPYDSQCKEEDLYFCYKSVIDFGEDTPFYMIYEKDCKPDFIREDMAAIEEKEDGSESDLGAEEDSGESFLDCEESGGNNEERGGTRDKGTNKENKPPYRRICFAEMAPWIKEPCKEDESAGIAFFKDIPLEVLPYMFHNNPFAILERLPISAVLTPGVNRLPSEELLQAQNWEEIRSVFKEKKQEEENELQKGEKIFADEISEREELEFFLETTCEMVTEELDIIGEELKAALRKKEKEEEDDDDDDDDDGAGVVLPGPFTSELLYEYDDGNPWKVRITASYNCMDLIDKVSQDTLDKANIKCRETYRPVLIYRDGDMVFDDVGGLRGFIEFLKAIHVDTEGMSPKQRKEALALKQQLLEKANSMGWKKKDAANMNLL